MSRPLRFGLWLTAIALVLGIAGRQLQIESDSRVTGDLGPWLQQRADHQIAIQWHSAEARRGTVELEPAAGGEALHLAETSSGTGHRIVTSGLPPRSHWRYRLDGGATPAGAFFTPPAKGDPAPLRLWVLGDAGVDSPLARKVRAAAQRWFAGRPAAGRPIIDLLLTTGDNAYPSGRFSDFRDAVFTPLAAVLAATPYWPVPGNHDLRRRAFFRLFEFPANGEAGGVPSGGEAYYAFDYGPLHVVVLDSESSLGRWERRKMRDWLARDLAADRQRWTIVVFHHPPYSRGHHDSDRAGGRDWRMQVMRETFLPVIDDSGVDLVLAGHSHVYERSHLLAGHYGTSETLAPAMIVQRGQGPGDRFERAPHCQTRCGVVYVVLGNSAKVDGGPLDHPAMAAVSARGGSLAIEIEAACLNAYLIGEDGAIDDRFTLVKHSNGTDGTCQPGPPGT